MDGMGVTNLHNASEDDVFFAEGLIAALRGIVLLLIADCLSSFLGFRVVIPTTKGKTFS